MRLDGRARQCSGRGASADTTRHDTSASAPCLAGKACVGARGVNDDADRARATQPRPGAHEECGHCERWRAEVSRANNRRGVNNCEQHADRACRSASNWPGGSTIGPACDHCRPPHDRRTASPTARGARRRERSPRLPHAPPPSLPGDGQLAGNCVGSSLYGPTHTRAQRSLRACTSDRCRRPVPAIRPSASRSVSER